MELAIINRSGQETGRKVDLPEELFGVDPNDHAIYLDVKHYLAAQRQGTHKSKERAEVNYSTKKIKKQKGTGGARAGSIKSPVFVGGGRVFGPRPRDYSFKLNKKVKTLARRSAVIHKLRANNLTVLESITFDKPSTKQYIDLMKGLGADGKKTLFLSSGSDKNLYLSSRNLQRSRVINVESANTYDMLHCDRLIVSENSLEAFLNLLTR